QDCTSSGSHRKRCAKTPPARAPFPPSHTPNSLLDDCGECGMDIRHNTPANPSPVPCMNGTPRDIATAALVGVSLVLLAGLWNMLRGGNPNLSQTLMRWRVLLQFLAIAIMMVLVYLFKS